MVMEGRHFENAFSVGGLEISHLDDVGHGFRNINNPHRDEDQGHIHGKGQGRHRAAHEQASGVPHENLGGVVVIAEEGRQSPRQGGGKQRQGHQPPLGRGGGEENHHHKGDAGGLP